MQPLYIIVLIAIYFAILLSIAHFTGKKDINISFFKADSKSPWYIIAFGMIGTSLSGVAFISIPGWVEESQFSYMQMVLGQSLGYIIIASILIPIYFKQNVTSIYEYLRNRLGRITHKTGASLFMVSRVLGASLRLYLVANVLQEFVLNRWQIPFYITVIIAILFIFTYTFKGGIKTIVWTDAFQTIFIISTIVYMFFILLKEIDYTLLEYINSKDFEPFKKIFFTKDFKSNKYFIKYFLSGAFIAICMTGLDQDMIQKSLSCKNIKESKYNMISYSIIIIPINLMFLFLGALLFTYASKNGIDVPVVNGIRKSDLLFPEVALNSGLGTLTGTLFILGLIASAYSSADSAITSLNTSVCYDFISINKYTNKTQKKIRKCIHLLISIALIIIIITLHSILKENLISNLLKIASYTYGPLLGIFVFGIFTKAKIKDKRVWIIPFISIALSFIIDKHDELIFGGYQIGYELLIINGLLTFIGMLCIKQKKNVFKAKKYYPNNE